MPNVPNNTLTPDTVIAHGLDRNDGTLGHGGVESEEFQIVANGGGNDVSVLTINELPDSPVFERAEQGTMTHHYEGPYLLLRAEESIYGRGTLTTDSFGNYYRVLSCSTQPTKGGMGLMTIVSESISFDAPPDEFNCQPVRLGLDILKHPRYFYALMPTNQIPDFTGIEDNPLQMTAKQAIIRAIQAYRENPYIPTSSNINGIQGALHTTIEAAFASEKMTISRVNPNYDPSINATPQLPITDPPSYPDSAASSGDPNPQTYLDYMTSEDAKDPNGKVALAMAAAREIIGKLWRMEDTPLVNGLEITWTEYYFRPPPLNLGSYIEDLIKDAVPALPDYFYSTEFPPDPTKTIFDSLSSFAPQIYSASGLKNGAVKISWLRDADVLEYNRTWFRVTRKWLGAPIGAWDAQIYSTGNRPVNPGDFVNLILN